MDVNCILYDHIWQDKTYFHDLYTIYVENMLPFGSTEIWTERRERRSQVGAGKACEGDRSGRSGVLRIWNQYTTIWYYMIL